MQRPGCQLAQSEGGAPTSPSRSELRSALAAVPLIGNLPVSQPLLAIAARCT